MPRYVASLDGQIPHPFELYRGSNRLFKCTYSVINNCPLFGLTIDQNRKAVLILRHTFPYEKTLFQRIIYVNKDDRHKKEKLQLCEITRGMKHSVTPCRPHEINECKQNTVALIPLETSSAKISATTNFLFSLCSLHTLNIGTFHDIM